MFLRSLPNLSVCPFCPMQQYSRGNSSGSTQANSLKDLLQNKIDDMEKQVLARVNTLEETKPATRNETEQRNRVESTLTSLHHRLTDLEKGALRCSLSLSLPLACSLFLSLLYCFFLFSGLFLAGGPERASQRLSATSAAAVKEAKTAPTVIFFLVSAANPVRNAATATLRTDRARETSEAAMLCISLELIVEFSGFLRACYLTSENLCVFTCA